MRDQLKSVWRCILTKNYSEDTVATIMYLLAKTNTPEKTLNKVLEILKQELSDEEIYQKLNKLNKL